MASKPSAFGFAYRTPIGPVRRGFFVESEFAPFLRLRRFHQSALFLRVSGSNVPRLSSASTFSNSLFSGPGVLMRIFWCLLLAAAALSGDIIDRMRSRWGNQVITESQIDEEIRITAFLIATN